MLSTRRSTEEIHLKHFVDLSQIKDYNQPFKFVPIIDEWKGSFSLIHHIGTKWWFVTNYNAPYKRIVSFDIMFPQEENWTEHFVGDENHQIEHVYFINGKFVVNYMKNSADYLSVYEMVENGPFKLLKEVDLPGRGSIKIETGEKETDTTFIFEYSSYTVPTTFYSLNMESYEVSKFW